MSNWLDVNGDASKLSEVEQIKAASNGLYDPVAQELGQPDDHFSEEAVQILKHHGTYQQDNRDVRLERKKKGLPPVYSMMVRTKFPGGRITAEQYLICDELSDRYGQHDMRATSRQDIQFHGVIRGNLRPLIRDLNRLARITTLGGCGDVVRNTMAPPVADIDPAYANCGQDLIELAEDIARRTLPKTPAYFDLWIDDEKAEIRSDGTVVFKSRSEPVHDPLYEKQYLPRKFKIGIAADFDNSVDVYTQDVGILAVTLPQYGGDGSGRIVGYEILIGGGLGFSHTKENTYPRLGTPLYFVSRDEIWSLLEAVIRIQRDYGERNDRKQARLKYTLDRLGEVRFRELVRQYAGQDFSPARGVRPTAQPDYLGWHAQCQTGLWYVGVWVENGRIRDMEDKGFRFKSGLRAVIEQFKPSIRITPHHNIILANIPEAQRDAVQACLDEYGLPTDQGISVLRRMEMACPALPLCPLAQSESERVMPDFMRGLEEAGHGDADVIIRMTGCPNGCARSSTAEIGLIGKGPGRYVLLVGGDYNGTRLNTPLDEKVRHEEVVPLIATLLTLWKERREPGERFGDWSYRVGVDTLRQMLGRTG